MPRKDFYCKVKIGKHPRCGNKPSSSLSLHLLTSRRSRQRPPRKTQTETLKWCCFLSIWFTSSNLSHEPSGSRSNRTHADSLIDSSEEESMLSVLYRSLNSTLTHTLNFRWTGYHFESVHTQQVAWFNGAWFRPAGSMASDLSPLLSLLLLTCTVKKCVESMSICWIAMCFPTL